MIASILITPHNKYHEVTLQRYSKFLQAFLPNFFQLQPQLPGQGQPIVGTAGALRLCGDTRLWPKAFTASSLHLRGLMSELTTLGEHQGSGIPWVPAGQHVSLPPLVNPVALGFADELFGGSWVKRELWSTPAGFPGC